MTDVRWWNPLLAWALVALGVGLVGAQATRPGEPSRPAQPTRDGPARQAAEEVPKGSITGRVTAADTGRPVRRARVFLSGPQVQGGRAALTDDEGRFELVELPEGRYTLTAGKTGFVTLSYGQRRPLQAGTPIQLADAQQLTGVEFRLPRGSVVTGHVFDETGDPLPGAAVRVLRYEYAQGNRQLVPVGMAQTDDLGAYRVWGLSPGEYLVSALTPAFGPGGGRGFFAGGGPPGRGGRGGPFGGRSGAGNVSPEAPEQLGYAPTFYPGVPSAADARAVSVGLSTEVASIDFSVLLVRTMRVAGRVTNPDGSPTTAGNIALLPEGTSRQARGGPGTTYGSRIDWDGSFAMTAVPPGRYVVRARGDDTVEPQFAVQPLTVADVDISDLIVMLQPGASVTGTVTFQNTRSQAVPDPGQIRVSAPLVDAVDVGPNPTARVERNGSFTLSGVQVGAHVFRAQGGPRGWTLKSVVVNGRDVIDSPIDLRSGQKLTGVALTFTDTLTEVNGTLADERGAPVTEYTMLAFPQDEELWRPLSRHIMTARPDQNGRYQMRGLPPGRYHLVAVDPAEQGEWFEPEYLAAHRASATSFALAEGDTKTQDFKVSSR